jgi:hypothetical protein
MRVARRNREARDKIYREFGPRAFWNREGFKEALFLFPPSL